MDIAPTNRMNGAHFVSPCMDGWIVHASAEPAQTGPAGERGDAGHTRGVSAQQGHVE
jgi:hypothetical protein